MPAIVTVNVSQQSAPTPNGLQKSGALLSQGATTTSKYTRTLLTGLSSLTPFLQGSAALTSITQTTGTATATAAAAHGFPIGDVVELTIAGATPAAYNGVFLCTITTTTAFTYAVPSGTSTPATGTPIYTPEDVAELLAMATTWFAQGSATAVTVLELGDTGVTDGVAALGAWITANPPTSPGGFYGFTVPRTWDGNAAYLSLIASYENTTALTYFWTTTTLATYQAYTSLMKCVIALIEAPAMGTWAANTLTALSYASGAATATTTTAHGVAVGQWFQITGCTPTGYNGWWQAITGTTGSTLVWAIATSPGAESVLGSLVASYYASSGIPALEFSMAAVMYDTISYSPGETNRVSQLLYAPVSGVTPFPAQGTSALTTTLSAANITYIGTGAEGGISGAIVIGGNTLDGNPFNYWYSVDWTNVNLNLNISNAVINGSAPGPSPLLLNQDGVNALQGVGAATLAAGISYGLIFGAVQQTELDPVTFATNSALGLYAGFAVINAVPFPTYYATNPGNFKIGLYGGFQVSMAPQRGFANIVINLQATTLVA